MLLLKKTLDFQWNAISGHFQINSHADVPPIKSAVYSLITNDLFSGKLYHLASQSAPYRNEIHGVYIDLSQSTLSCQQSIKQEVQVSREQILSNQRVQSVYELFSNHFLAYVDQLLPITQQQHLVIRDENYVSGSYEQPEVAVFAQSRSDRIPLPDSRLHVGQKIWMKWVGGPIVASANMQSWHTLEYQDQNINEVRKLTLGTNLFGMSDYWSQVQAKERGWVTVIHLKDEQWIDPPIFSDVRSRGSSWLYLDTLRKQILWLCQSWEPEPPLKDPSRSIPKRLRFKILRRDESTCRYCGAKAPHVKLHVDHVIPWIKVKCHEAHNLVTACQDCNLGKSAMSLTSEQIDLIHKKNLQYEMNE